MGTWFSLRLLIKYCLNLRSERPATLPNNCGVFSVSSVCFTQDRGDSDVAALQEGSASQCAASKAMWSPGWAAGRRTALRWQIKGAPETKKCCRCQIWKPRLVIAVEGKATSMVRLKVFFWNQEINRNHIFHASIMNDHECSTHAYPFAEHSDSQTTLCKSEHILSWYMFPVARLKKRSKFCVFQCFPISCSPWEISLAAGMVQSQNRSWRRDLLQERHPKMKRNMWKFLLRESLRRQKAKILKKYPRRKQWAHLPHQLLRKGGNNLRVELFLPAACRVFMWMRKMARRFPPTDWGPALRILWRLWNFASGSYGSCALKIVYRMLNMMLNISKYTKYAKYTFRNI